MCEPELVQEAIRIVSESDGINSRELLRALGRRSYSTVSSIMQACTDLYWGDSVMDPEEIDGYIYYDGGMV